LRSIGLLQAASGRLAVEIWSGVGKPPSQGAQQAMDLVEARANLRQVSRCVGAAEVRRL
jgi:hypothetical protein